MMKIFKSRILLLLLNDIYVVKGDIPELIHCVGKKMARIQTQEPSWFKLGMTIDTTELYISR